MKIWKSKKNTAIDVEKWITALYKEGELDLTEYKIPEEKYTWLTYFGEIPVYINIDTSEPEIEFIIINSVLCEIPLKKEHILPFYRKCLELNTLFFGASLTINETRVSFFQKRDIEFITEPILGDMIRYQINITEHVLKELAEEFEIVPSKSE